MLEGLCTKLFLPTESVAKFIQQHYGIPQPAIMHHFREELSTLLKGKLVTIKTSYGSEQRAIYLVSNDNPATADEDDKHFLWRGKPDVQLQYPTLPCLNVGTPMNHMLIPPEMCVFQPMQSFKVRHTVNLDRDLTAVRKKMTAASLVSPEAKMKLSDTLLITKQPKRDDKGLDEQLKEAFNNDGPNVLLVEAGVNKLPKYTSTMFRQAMIKNKILEKNDMAVKDVEPLFLQFRPDSNVVNLWRTQFTKFLSKHAENRKKTTIVILLQPDKHEKHIYKVIKCLGDCDLGFQTFFFNTANAELKLRQFGKDGPYKITNEIVSRMRMRNPPPPPPAQELQGKMDIAVAYHIAPITAPVPSLDDNGVIGTNTTPRYLVTFSTRDISESRYYLTKILLKSPQQMQDYDPCKDMIAILSKLLPKDKSKHRVTVIRSGYMVAEQERSEGGHGRELAIPVSIDMVDHRPALGAADYFDDSHDAVE
ncbi:hypothetical protein LTR37_004071 [Vermiconidia calcicola]|uniref:Uncharacterized protein n=1 Tax=Vermiconidia calcicola TaxID=1690605 RepID=A0ACC3NPS0_9PEZI|nr:hypothetical protein LTR37_004071 [Vermiconidia calcicola]